MDKFSARGASSGGDLLWLGFRASRRLVSRHVVFAVVLSYVQRNQKPGS
jgi:hypothetical protein